MTYLDLDLGLGLDLDLDRDRDRTVLAPAVARHCRPRASDLLPFSEHAVAIRFVGRRRWPAMSRAGAWKWDRHEYRCCWHRQRRQQELSRSPGLGSAHAAVRAGERDAPDPQ